MASYTGGAILGSCYIAAPKHIASINPTAHAQPLALRARAAARASACRDLYEKNAITTQPCRVHVAK